MAWAAMSPSCTGRPSASTDTTPAQYRVRPVPATSLPWTKPARSCHDQGLMTRLWTVWLIVPLHGVESECVTWFYSWAGTMSTPAPGRGRARQRRSLLTEQRILTAASELFLAD